MLQISLATGKIYYILNQSSGEFPIQKDTIIANGDLVTISGFKVGLSHPPHSMNLESGFSCVVGKTLLQHI